MRAVALTLMVASCASGPGSLSGRVLSVEGEGLEVTSFVLITEGGRQFEFAVDPAAISADFPLSHLRDHLLSGEPVRVTFRVAEGTYLALAVEDA